jgi:uncharacterized protein DUF6232
MDQIVQVDDKFARFGSKSYAINKINSVDVRVHRPHSQAATWICGLVALISVISLLGSLSDPEGLSGGALVLAAVFAGLSYVSWQKSQTREYQLFLMTSSSETEAFVTRDRDEVLRLRERIEEAMAAS